jgi:ubiquitin carboxyl-terminal hydrolase 7
MASIEEEIVELKVDHWDITNWSELETRTVGPIIKAGGHDW